MTRTLILTIAALAAALTLTPVAQATPGCASYIKVCARPDAAHTGNGGDSPFYTVVRDPITHAPVVNPATGGTMKQCRSGCDHVKPGDRTLGD